MEAVQNSELAMVSEKLFDKIIDNIKQSRLNFQLQQSPYSAIISLKKSFQKDKSGNFVIPADFKNCQGEVPSRQNQELHAEIERLTSLNTSYLEELEKVKLKLKNVELDLELKCEKYETIDNEVHSLLNENKELKKINTDLIESLKNWKSDAEGSIKTKSEVIKKLNKELGEMKEKHSVAISDIKQDYKTQIKSLKNNLRKKGKEVSKLQKQIEDTIVNDETVNTLAAEKFDEDMDIGLSLLDKHHIDSSLCTHTPQCTIRQPRPPPLPRITHLRDDVSRYHEHMLSKAGVPGAYGGHDSCLNVSDSKNYGCNSCVWFKWHGQLHGFPDINPYYYKKYLDSHVDDA